MIVFFFFNSGEHSNCFMFLWLFTMECLWHKWCKFQNKCMAVFVLLNLTFWDLHQFPIPPYILGQKEYQLAFFSYLPASYILYVYLLGSLLPSFLLSLDCILGSGQTSNTNNYKISQLVYESLQYHVGPKWIISQ